MRKLAALAVLCSMAAFSLGCEDQGKTKTPPAQKVELGTPAKSGGASTDVKKPDEKKPEVKPEEKKPEPAKTDKK